MIRFLRYVLQSPGSYGRLEEYNGGLTVLMWMLSSWCNRYQDKLWAPWKPPFIKYLGIAWNAVVSSPLLSSIRKRERERWPGQMYEVCTTNFPVLIWKPSWARQSDYNSLLKYGRPIGFYHFSLWFSYFRYVHRNNNVDIWQCNESHNSQVKTPMKTVYSGQGLYFFSSGIGYRLKDRKRNDYIDTFLNDTMKPIESIFAYSNCHRVKFILMIWIFFTLKVQY